MDESVLEDFGQRVDLTRRIREVLANYPEGTAVLKELIQNADDAGATTVRLCLDRRRHGEGSLLSPALAQWQGPALLAYNDAVFTEEDFASISRVGGSGKQGHPWKTGRFGVGFNSVYHLTDLPSFVSGKYFVIFDPQRAYLPNISSSNPGKRLEYVSSSAIAHYKDQLSPYCAFGCDMVNPFQGTLFRFPLRNPERAAVSKLSKQMYLESDIISLFSQLYKEAALIMLFLKNVCAIEMYTWDVDMDEPCKVYSSSINSIDEDTIWHRQALLRFSESTGLQTTNTDSYCLELQNEKLSSTHSEKNISKFFIMQSMANATSKIGAFALSAAKDYDLHLLPWVSMAACISASASEDDDMKQGRAFCFLPLPVRTGLTVQINGFFEIASNRRSIWYGDDMDRGGKVRSDWNKLLLEDALAPLYCKFLLTLCKQLGPSKLYYSLWPTGSFEEPWSHLVDHIYRNVCNLPLVYCELDNGCWLHPATVFFPDLEYDKSDDLSRALLLLQMPIVQLPVLVVEILSRYVGNFYQRVVNPLNVRIFLKSHNHVLELLSRSDKLMLLEYCISDLVDEDVGKHAKGLPLLPLANGHFGTLLEPSNALTFYICNESEYKLLEPLSERAIDRCIPPMLFNRLSSIARTSEANILLFDNHCFLQLLPALLPSVWKFKDMVCWPSNSEENVPSVPWFSLFWKYLNDECYDLSLLDDWPIFPSTSHHLYRGSKSSKLINLEPLPVLLRDLLLMMGCKALNLDFGVAHRDLHHYVYNSDGPGVLNAIFQLVSSRGDVQLLFHGVTEEAKTSLRDFLLDPRWYYEGIFNENDISKCKKLPIYRTYGGGLSHSFHFSNIEGTEKFLPPLDIPEYFISDGFIYSSSNREEEVLQRYYGIKRMEKATFYRRIVLIRVKELAPEIRDSVMLGILRDLPQLCLADPTFKELLQTLEFIPTGNGTLKNPQSLYDPRVDELVALLEDSDCFPSGLFEDCSALDMLLGLGLRTSVSYETILESARQIEQMMHKDQMKAHSRGKVLLSYLEVNATRWSHIPYVGHKKSNKIFSKVVDTFKAQNITVETNLEKFWNDLKLICWCPVMLTAPYSALPWPSVSTMVAPPRLVRLPVDLWLVSASMRILDGECSSSVLAFMLGWSSPPSGSVVAAQLLELGKNNEMVTDQALREELTLAMPKVYSLLMSLLNSDEMDLVKAILEGSRWIWVGDGFATTNEVILDGQLYLAPYIRVVPVDLAVFSVLFIELGVRESLSPADYANILSRMASKKTGKPLSGPELRTAVAVLQHLAELQSENLDFEIHLPDSSSRLFPAKELVFNDAPWLLENGDSLIGGGEKTGLHVPINVHKYVHGNVSNDVAERLGARSLRRLLLMESSDSMNVTLSGVAEAFGQHEALTTRLKHIVEMYADGPGIMFELVQNAEDAGASEVVFLLDKTQYGTSSILSPDMGEWQGPALYCFNNSVFTSQDLYSISRIGQDSKVEKPLAIGRFGLGFNCVYHFTDVPGFVSGDNIVIFDPHAFYLPGISPSHPGLRIRYSGRRILEQFPDQFSPFLHFGCDLQHSFPGTLFRFPLRGPTAASRSQIKQEKYSPEDVLSLFSSFSETVTETLLFLRKIINVSIYVKNGHDQEMQLLHTFSKNSGSIPRIEPHPLNAMFSFLRGHMKNGMNKEQFFAKLGKTLDKDLPWSCEKVTVTQKTPSSERCHVWMISECIAGGHAKSKSLSSKDRSCNLIPWACVASCLYSLDANKPAGTSDECLFPNKNDIPGRAFCFLPLPIQTGLPIHLNAYFELSSNRRDIWFGNDMAGGGKMRSDWNICLLEDAVAPAYAHLLEVIAMEFGPCDLFFSLWPNAVVPEPWASVVKKLYMCITDLGLRVLYTHAREGKWIAPKQAIFPDLAFPKMDKLSEALCAAGLPIVSFPRSVLEKMMVGCSSIRLLSPRLLRTLIIRRQHDLIDKTSAILILEYCLTDIKESASYDDLHGLPLVPLSSGSFATFNKNALGERIFVACDSGFHLLKHSVPHLVVDCTISDVVFSKLTDIAESASLNLSLLTCVSLHSFLPRILPTDWRHAKMVSWTPGENGQPSLDWMELLWDYLKSSCSDLLTFQSWPILPVENGFLVQLTRNSNVIKGDGWSENMSSLLQKLGCFLLRSDVRIEHPQLDIFVQDSTLCGVLNAFQFVGAPSGNILSLFTNVSEGERRELRSFLFQSKWFFRGYVDCSHIDIIKSLPIFEVYQTRKFISLTGFKKWLKPEDIPDNILDESFICTESEREKEILKIHFDVREPSKAEFYKDYVLENIQNFVPQPTVLLTILKEVKLLVEEDLSLKSVLSEVPFVLLGNGSWACPSRLYDPRISGLQTLLHKKAFFPDDLFLDPEVLDTLACLGLRKTLGFDGLLDIARSISLYSESEKGTDLHIHGKRLLAFLTALGSRHSGDVDEDHHGSEDLLFPRGGDHAMGDAMFLSLEDHAGELELENHVVELDLGELLILETFTNKDQEDMFWAELRKINWCPVYVDPPVRGFPWLQSSQHVAYPGITRPRSQMWMVSSKMRILNGECCSYVQSRLGWKDPPSIHVLSTQLVELSKAYDELKLYSDHNILNTKLQREVLSIYSKLQKFIGTDEFHILKTSLSGSSWVWIGDNFTSPTSLAFDSPVKFHPYLYVVPSELTEFRVVLLELGVKLTFDAMDYLHILQCLEHDYKGKPLSAELLNFVRCILDAVSDCFVDKPSDAFAGSLILPDSSGVLRPLMDLLYNDAPWMERNTPASKHFVHPIITDDLAQMLGVQSLRSLSLVDENMTTDLPCMDYAEICNLLALYGDSSFLFFDLLELADCCKARRLHLIYDKREHSRLSLLQNNLGEFQGPALVAVMEGASLTREEICSLQFRPPWNVKGVALNYGLGLLGCHFVCDFLSVVSSGYLYMFDPLGLALAPPSTNAPTAKMFSLIGTDLTKRFRDQFDPMLIINGVSLNSSDTTIIRMPLSSKCVTEIESGSKKIKQIFERFMSRASPALLFLKSVLQVSLWTYEEHDAEPSINFSVSIDPPSALMRNPFVEKKWKKFHLSRLFGNTTAATKLQVIDLHVNQGGLHITDKWVTSLSLGSGQTRNMALDRKYLAYNLTPIAGIAVHVSQDGKPIERRPPACVLSPLPLSGDLSIPVIALGCFLVCHNGGRYLFSHHDSSNYLDLQYQLVEAWNKELMSCVRDSYVELVLEFQKLRRNPLTSSMHQSHAQILSFILKAYGEKIYSFWPRSNQKSLQQSEDGVCLSSMRTPGADWLCLIECVIRPFYECLVDLPVWQLYHGDVVKANEGMFLCHSGSQVGNDLPPLGVCSFIREHYPVFAVPSELVSEIQAVGVKVREIRPKMVRNLLKSSPSLVLHSLDVYIDVLSYCLSDIELQTVSNISGDAELTSIPHLAESNGSGNLQMLRNAGASSSSMQRRVNSGNDALEIMSSFGKALYDFGRGVVEEMGRSGGPLNLRNSVEGDLDFPNQGAIPILGELKGLPFPTAKMNLARLGITELWVGNKEQLLLMQGLVDRFVHPQCSDHPIVSNLLKCQLLHGSLKLKHFSPQLLSANMRYLFPATWISHVESKTTPCILWDKRTELSGDGPSIEWIKLFWKNFNSLSGDLALVRDWPLIPAFLNGSVLCRIRYHDMVFVPPILEMISGNNESNFFRSCSTEHFLMDKYLASFEMIHNVHPWLCPILERCNIPIYDMSFSNCGAPVECFPALDQTLGKVIAGRLLASKRAGFFSEPDPFSHEDRERFLGLFVMDFGTPEGSGYTREELEMLSQLPIYKTTAGNFTRLRHGEHYLVSSSGFFHPRDDMFLDSGENEAFFLHALGVLELNDQEVLVKFSLHGFEGRTSEEQEDVLIYLLGNWNDLHLNSSVVNALKQTKFVRNSAECSQYFKPSELFDPSDSLLSSIFATERERFPGERFATDEWLEILRKTGLRKSSEADVILECARKLEFLGSSTPGLVSSINESEHELFKPRNEISSDTWSLAEALVSTIFANFSVLYDKKFCDVISTIKFIPSEKGFPSVGGKNFNKRVLCSYDEAILLKDWSLAWSCAPILSKKTVVPPEYSWGAFHLRTPPIFSTVLKHLQIIGRNNGEDTLAHWPTSMGILTVEEATCEILKFLDKIWGSLSTSDISELQKVAFLPVANGTRLVTVGSLFARLTYNISPFAFELPACYLPHVKVLKELGMQDILTIPCSKDLLLHIQRSCGYQRLNPNELRAVMELLHFICDGSSNGRADRKDLLSDAVVPDDGCRLVLARTCVYIDTPGSRILSNIDTSRLRFSHPYITESICTVLGIKKLSSIVVEEVDNSEEVQVQGDIRSVTVECITEKLRNPPLQEALWIVINNLSNQVSSIEKMTLDQIRDSLENMARNLRFVKYLYTRFLLLPNSLDITKRSKNLMVPEWEGTTRNRTVYFVDRSRIRILVAEPPSYMSLYDVLAIVVSEVLNLPVILPVGSLFSGPSNHEKAISNILRLGSDTRVPFFKQSNMVDVGKELMAQDALQVQLHPLRPFYAGEIVAWRMGMDGEKLKYGRIPKDVRPSAGQALYRLSVQTSTGETQLLLSSQVFSFKSVSLEGDVPSSSSTSSSQDGADSEQKDSIAENSRQISATIQRTPNDSQYGKVSAVELVQAVHDMLSMAGIHLDSEKKSLLETTLTLQERLEEAQVALLVEQEKAETAAKEADTAKSAWSCRICLSAEVCITLVPCGHVLCLRCSNAVSRCPFCRTQVSRTLKIYRP